MRENKENKPGSKPDESKTREEHKYSRRGKPNALESRKVQNPKPIVQTEETITYFKSSKVDKIPAGTSLHINGVHQIFVPENVELGLSSNLITNFIGAFSTARGYTSSTTATTVIDYIENSVRAFAILIALKRNQDYRELRDDAGRKIGTMYCTTSKKQDKMSFDTEMPANSMVLASHNHQYSISNAQWAQDYLSKVPLFMMNDFYYEETLFKYSSVFIDFKSNFGASVQLWPATGSNTDMSTYSGGYFKAEFTRLVTALETARNSYPDLILILKALGFTNAKVIEHDYQRDVHGITINYKDFELLRISAVNAVAKDKVDLDKVKDKIILTPAALYDPMDRSDQAELKLTDLIAVKRIGIYEDYGVACALVSASGTFSVSVVSCYMQGDIEITSLTGLAAAQTTEALTNIGNLAESMIMTGQYSPMNCQPYEAAYVLSPFTTTSDSVKRLNFASAKVIFDNVAWGNHIYNETDKAFVANKLWALKLFGINWRSALQAKINSISYLANK